MRLKLKAKLSSDLTLVLAANLFSYFITFGGSVIYVRLLGKSEFGVYTFAFGIISLFLLVNGLGVASGVLQYVSRAQTQAEREAYVSFALTNGALFNLGMGIVIVVYALVVPLPISSAKPILLSMALFPVGRLYIDVYQAYLRASGQNQLQAKFLIFNNSLLLICNVVGVYCFKLDGLIYFTYLGYALMYLISAWRWRWPGFSFRPQWALIKARSFIKFSLFSSFSNACSGLLFVLDTIIISYVVKEPQLLASYRVATIIPFAINFIPNLVINFYYPEFAKNAHNSQLIRSLARRISLRMFMFSAMLSVVLIISAPWLIKLVFGANYPESVVPFQIISFGYWIIASFRSINGNILAALGKARLSFYLTMVILGVNVVLTYLLVVHYSIIGAAVAIVIMYVFSSLIGYIALQLVLKQNPIES